MTSNISTVLALILMIFTAIGYAIATVGMKMASDGVSALALGCITAGLCAAVLAEVTLLRHADLAVIYIGVVFAETLLVLAYAASVSGVLGLQQIVGAALVLSGFALVSLGD